MNSNDIAGDKSSVRQMILGYQVSRALLAADELGLIEHISEGAKTAEELATETDTHAHSLYRFMRALTTIDLLREDENNRFSLSPLAEGLHTAARIGVESYKAWAELPYSLKTGAPAFDRVHGKDFYSYLAEEPTRAARFDAALAAVSRDWMRSVFEAYDFPKTGTVVDVGGGRGTFIAELLKLHPNLSGILFDQPEVVGNAKPILEDASVISRCKVVGGDFFESIPSGGDIYTMCNLLTDWGDEQSEKILINCRKAMNKYGRVLIIDRVLPPPGDPNRQSMAFLDLFFLILEGGCIRTREEFARLLRNAGLELTKFIGTANTFSVIEGCTID